MVLLDSVGLDEVPHTSSGSFLLLWGSLSLLRCSYGFFRIDSDFPWFLF